MVRCNSNPQMKISKTGLHRLRKNFLTTKKLRVPRPRRLFSGDLCKRRCINVMICIRERELDCAMTSYRSDTDKQILMEVQSRRSGDEMDR